MNDAVVREFRANAGVLSGPMEGAPILLLTTSGRRSGTPHTTPVGFVDADGSLAVAAANGGSDQHPDWYRNIEHDNEVTIEVPGASIRCTANTTSGSERDRLLVMLSETLPGMDDHIAATGREIPVVILNEAS